MAKETVEEVVTDQDEEVASPSDSDAEESPIEAPPETPRGKYQVADWSGLPNFGCPYCEYATLDGDGAVELHILEMIERPDIHHQPALQTGG